MKVPNGVNDLRAIAHKAMIARGLEPDFPPDAIRQLNGIQGPAHQTDTSIRDLRDRIWCSIDNDTSKDLDQLTVAEKQPAGRVKVLVAIADVDALIKPRSAIDRHAWTNTTSVYTAAQIFPMLPERLSTDLTSLGEGEDRLAIVIEMVVAADGSVESSEVYRAVVNNRAKLAYRSVAAWLDGTAKIPEKIAKIGGLDEQLRMQDQIAQTMKSARYLHGALDLETIQPEAVISDGKVVDLRLDKKNRAKELIEDFMIAANGVSAEFLEKHGLPALRRVVRTPKRWDRIQKVAQEFGDQLPNAPDSKALADFLARRRQADPLRYPDLSLTIIKLLGAGEYILQLPGQDSAGHFGLAVHDYSHSTAPNRRFPDLITQRLLKAALVGEKLPYENAALTALAAHCTEQEDAAKKVERQVRKSAAAQFLAGRIGETFDALVTGASEKGTYVRLLNPPVEGRLVAGYDSVDVGDQIKVRLTNLDVERGFIDFNREPDRVHPTLGAPKTAAHGPPADRHRPNGER
jgi:exoribonuclease II